jgi:hypothetical protein
MSFIEADPVVTVLAGTGGGGALAWWIFRRWVDRFDRLESRVLLIENQMVRLATKDDVATREDFAQVAARLDKVESALGQVQVMLGRIDERWKLTHGE